MFSSGAAVECWTKTRLVLTLGTSLGYANKVGLRSHDYSFQLKGHLFCNGKNRCFHPPLPLELKDILGLQPGMVRTAIRDG